MLLIDGTDYVDLSANVFNEEAPYASEVTATSAYVTLVREISRQGGSHLRELKPLQAAYDAEMDRIRIEREAE